MTSPTGERAPTPAPFVSVEQKVSNGWHFLRLNVSRNHIDTCASALDSMANLGARVFYDRESPFQIYVASRVDQTSATLVPLLEKVDGLYQYLNQLAARSGS